MKRRGKEHTSNSSDEREKKSSSSYGEGKSRSSTVAVTGTKEEEEIEGSSMKAKIDPKIAQLSLDSDPISLDSRCIVLLPKHISNFQLF